MISLCIVFVQKKPEEQLTRRSVQKKTAPKKKASPKASPLTSSQNPKNDKSSNATNNSKSSKSKKKQNVAVSYDAAVASPEIHQHDVPEPAVSVSGGASPEAVRDEIVSDDLPRDVRTKLNYTLVGYDESVDPDSSVPTADNAEENVSPEIQKREPEPAPIAEPEPDLDPTLDDEPESVVPTVKRKASRRRLRRI